MPAMAHSWRGTVAVVLMAVVEVLHPVVVEVLVPVQAVVVGGDGGRWRQWRWCGRWWTWWRR